MSCGNSATVYFKGRLESLLQKAQSVSLKSRVHFHLAMAAVEIGVFSAVPFIFESFN